MNFASLVIALVAVAIAGGASYFAYQAAKVAKRAAAAAERAARTGEQLADLEKRIAARNADAAPPWRIERTAGPGNLFSLVNNGPERLTDVTMTAQDSSVQLVDAPAGITLEPRGQSVFRAQNTIGIRPRRIVVTWTRPNGRTQQWHGVVPARAVTHSDN